MGPPFTADAPVGISAPVAKALAAKQTITDLGNMAAPPRRRLYWKMGRASPLSTGRDARFIVRDANGQALAYARALLGSIQTELLQICKLLFEAK